MFNLLGVLLLFFCFVLNISAEEQLVFKNQKHSQIKWESLKEKEFLDIKHWIQEQDLKDSTPEWESLLRERLNQELVGYVMHCVGTCKIDKGDGYIKPQYRSKLYEGEEIFTAEDSYLWLYLVDGTIVRLSPESSVTIVEFNVMENGFFVFARVNFGNVLYLSRTKEKVKEDNEKETDVSFFPLPMYEAMSETRVLNYDETNLENFLIENDKNLAHKISLNKLIEENNSELKNRFTYTFLVFPTGTIEGESVQAEVISHFGEDSFIVGKDADSMDLDPSVTLTNLKITLRGLEQFETLDLPRGAWYRINSRGREMSTLEEDHWPRSGEFITRRITSILHMRERMFKTYSFAYYLDEFDRTYMANEFGLRVWKPLDLTFAAEKVSESNQRLYFLREYTRRLETSNILVGERFREKLIQRNEKVDFKKYGNRYFGEALRRYLISTPEILTDEERFDKNSTEKLLWKIKYGIK